MRTVRRGSPGIAAAQTAGGRHATRYVVTRALVRHAVRMAAPTSRSRVIQRCATGSTTTTSVSSRPDSRRFNHQDNRSFWRSRAMHDAVRHQKTLPGLQLHGAALEIDEKPPLDQIEELVFGVVLVPMELAVQYAETHDRVVDST